MPNSPANPASTRTAQIEAALQRGASLHRAGKLAEAEPFYAEVLRLDAQHFYGTYLLGLIALQTNRPDRAAELIGKAIAISPNVDEAHINRGIALLQLSQVDVALQCFDRAVSLSPNSADAHEHRGHAFSAMGDWQRASEAYDRALRVDSQRIRCLSGRATAAYHLYQYERALADFDRAIALNPADPAGYNDRGNVLRALLRHGPAIADYDKAIALHPDHAQAHYNRGNALRDSQRYEAAIESYARALALNPRFPSARTLRLYTKLQICDWRDHAAEALDVEARLDTGDEVANPFFVLALTGEPAIQRKSAEHWVRHNCPPSSELGPVGSQPEHARIRVAYLSADFHDHATTHLMAELFEVHDRAKIDLTLISFGNTAADAMTARLRRACADFIDAKALSDRELALLCRRKEIDIAVDLKGYTQERRTGIFAARAAPIQVSYLGYPGTMGAPYIDYLIADRTLIPAGAECHYTEKILFMPNSYQVNDRRRRIDERVFTRAELGLPEAAFVLCCFNNVYKITPEVFSAWMRILARVEAGVLWMLTDDPSAMRHLRAAARAAGISEARLIFAGQMPPPLHLARHRAADLFLDTLPYGAHTTASDALWAGLPVLTRTGASFAGRVAASLLRAVGVSELITVNSKDYEEMAVALATQPERLRGLRRQIAANRMTCPLFDAATFARQLESGYGQIYEQYRSGLPPDHVHVPA